MIEKREQLINDLETLSEEIRCEEIESNQSVLDTIQIITDYFKYSEEVLKDNKIINKDDLIDAIKSLIDELICDDCNENTINIFKNILAELKTV